MHEYRKRPRWMLARPPNVLSSSEANSGDIYFYIDRHKLNNHKRISSYPVVGASLTVTWAC